jgi:hypothetical protein
MLGHVLEYLLGEFTLDELIHINYEKIEVKNG